MYKIFNYYVKIYIYNFYNQLISSVFQFILHYYQ